MCPGAGADTVKKAFQAVDDLALLRLNQSKAKDIIARAYILAPDAIKRQERLAMLSVLFKSCDELTAHLQELSEREQLHPPGVKTSSVVCVGKGRWRQIMVNLDLLQGGLALPKRKYKCRIDLDMLRWAIAWVERRCGLGLKGGHRHTRYVEGVAHELPAFVRAASADSFKCAWRTDPAVKREANLRKVKKASIPGDRSIDMIMDFVTVESGSSACHSFIFIRFLNYCKMLRYELRQCKAIIENALEDFLEMEPELVGEGPKQKDISGPVSELIADIEKKIKAVDAYESFAKYELIKHVKNRDDHDLDPFTARSTQSVGCATRFPPHVLTSSQHCVSSASNFTGFRQEHMCLPIKLQTELRISLRGCLTVSRDCQMLKEELLPSVPLHNDFVISLKCSEILNGCQHIGEGISYGQS